MLLTRRNKLGLTYVITSEPDSSKTRIQKYLENKHIIVDMPIEIVIQCWYNWMMKGEFIQDAFGTLSNSEREFIMTGITDTEWNEIFSEEEN